MKNLPQNFDISNFKLYYDIQSLFLYLHNPEITPNMITVNGEHAHVRAFPVITGNCYSLPLHELHF